MIQTESPREFNSSISDAEFDVELLWAASLTLIGIVIHFVLEKFPENGIWIALLLAFAMPFIILKFNREKICARQNPGQPKWVHTVYCKITLLSYAGSIAIATILPICVRLFSIEMYLALTCTAIIAIIGSQFLNTEGWTSSE